MENNAADEEEEDDDDVEDDDRDDDNVLVATAPGDSQKNRNLLSTNGNSNGNSRYRKTWI